MKTADAKKTNGDNVEVPLPPGSSRKSFAFLFLIFVTAIVCLFMVYMRFPALDEKDRQSVKLPRSISDAQALAQVLLKYRDDHYYSVLLGYFITYIFLQTFAIPGSIFLSIISGFLFPFHLALCLICMCSGIGASFCYFLSYMAGRKLVKRYFPDRAADWAAHVKKHSEHLLNYIIFLRITPFLPNWFINVSSPVVGVPLKPFFIGTVIGVAPPSFVAIQAGTTLHELTSHTDAVSMRSITVLALLAVLSMMPVIFKRRLQKYD